MCCRGLFANFAEFCASLRLCDWLCSSWSFGSFKILVFPPLASGNPSCPSVITFWSLGSFVPNLMATRISICSKQTWWGPDLSKGLQPWACISNSEVSLSLSLSLGTWESFLWNIVHRKDRAFVSQSLLGDRALTFAATSSQTQRSSLHLHWPTLCNSSLLWLYL